MDGSRGRHGHRVGWAVSALGSAGRARFVIRFVLRGAMHAVRTEANRYGVEGVSFGRVQSPTDSSMSEPAPVARRRFLWCAAGTVATIYALILVGGIVRASGSGMGCPDWPMCFGQWIPPTSASELPANYQEIYADRGYAETEFNVRKTWTEYLNRLLGAFTGLAILATLVCAWPYRRSDRGVLALSAAGFVLVGVQGWLGSRVVASNLHPGMITVHMLLAQLIVGLIIVALWRAGRSTSAVRAAVPGESGTLPRWTVALLVAAIGAGLLQLVVGTQVREAVDLVARASDHADRHLWIAALPGVYGVHKWLALPLVVLNGALIWLVLSRLSAALPRAMAIALAALMLGTLAVGTGMERLNLPVFAQPLHLWFGSLIFGLQLALLLVVRGAVLARGQAKEAALPGETAPDESDSVCARG